MPLAYFLPHILGVTDLMLYLKVRHRDSHCIPRWHFAMGPRCSSPSPSSCLGPWRGLWQHNVHLPLGWCGCSCGSSGRGSGAADVLTRRRWLGSNCLQLHSWRLSACDHLQQHSEQCKATSCECILSLCGSNCSSSSIFNDSRNSCRSSSRIEVEAFIRAASLLMLVM